MDDVCGFDYASKARKGLSAGGPKTVEASATISALCYRPNVRLPLVIRFKNRNSAGVTSYIDAGHEGCSYCCYVLSICRQKRCC